MTVMPGTAVTTRTQIEMQNNYDDFNAAWASAQETVMEFAQAHPDACIKIDDTGGWTIHISLVARPR